MSDSAISTVYDQYGTQYKTCFECDQQFENPTDYIGHIRTHPGYQKFECSHCGMRFVTNPKMEEHIKNTHIGQGKYACRFCPETFKYPVSRTQHEQIHKDEKEYRCPICNETFKVAQFLTAHKKSKHRTVNYKCKICEKEVRSKGAVTTHLKIVHGLEYMAQYKTVPVKIEPKNEVAVLKQIEPTQQEITEFEDVLVLPTISEVEANTVNLEVVSSKKSFEEVETKPNPVDLNKNESDSSMIEISKPVNDSVNAINIMTETGSEETCETSPTDNMFDVKVKEEPIDICEKNEIVVNKEIKTETEEDLTVSPVQSVASSEIQVNKSTKTFSIFTPPGSRKRKHLKTETDEKIAKKEPEDINEPAMISTKDTENLKVPEVKQEHRQQTLTDYITSSSQDRGFLVWTDQLDRDLLTAISNSTANCLLLIKDIERLCEIDENINMIKDLGVKKIRITLLISENDVMQWTLLYFGTGQPPTNLNNKLFREYEDIEIQLKNHMKVKEIRNIIKLSEDEEFSKDLATQLGNEVLEV